MIRRMIQKTRQIAQKTIQKTMESKLAKKIIQTTKLSGTGMKILMNPDLILGILTLNN